ncbi:MAG: hypothetical protein M3Q71_06595 [Chloroflexota bacterium]|nr:hypothetical protein [Chloroflexota bacterium]MDP9470323.1 hypothetical protein [Chloroflexota bacterium]
MDVTTVVVTLIIVLGLGGGGAFLLRDFGRQILSRDATGLTEALWAREDAELERLRGELRAVVAEAEGQLGRLRQRGAELEALVAGGRERLALAEQAATQALALAAGRAQPEPAPLKTRNGAGAALLERRAEVLTELYGRLARVEAALAALTNPILLPGEPYTVPDAFLPEALKWENWKEVGDSAFALGGYFNQHRLQLDAATGAAVGACVTTLRTALTQFVYPNLQPNPTPEQAETLRAGLQQIAATLPTTRGCLEACYRELSGVAGHPQDDGDVV